MVKPRLVGRNGKRILSRFPTGNIDDDCYEVSDEEWTEEVYRWLDDERSNLNKEVDGIIVVFGNLGLWNGRRQGYQILGSNIADILKSQCDDAEWYGDGYNIRGRMGHHDGTNYTLYRIAKDRDEAERIADKIYNREIDEEGFRRRTFPLSVCSRRVRLENKAAQAGQGRINVAHKIPQRICQRWLRYPLSNGRDTEPSPFIISFIPFLSLLTE